MTAVGICDKAALRQVIRDLERIAHECAISPEAAKKNLSEVASEPRHFTDRELSMQAERIYQMRRRRERRIGHEFFGEPAWDILLDLFIHYHKHIPVSITSACIGSVAPKTTALRWLSVMERSHLIERYAKRTDRRVTQIRLTKKGLRLIRDTLTNYLSSCMPAHF